MYSCRRTFATNGAYHDQFSNFVREDTSRTNRKTERPTIVERTVRLRTPSVHAFVAWKIVIYSKSFVRNKTKNVGRSRKIREYYVEGKMRGSPAQRHVWGTVGSELLFLEGVSYHIVIHAVVININTVDYLTELN